MTNQRTSERTSDDATRIERRRAPKPGMFPEWMRPIFRAGWVVLAILFLFVLAGADLAEWIIGNG